MAENLRRICVFTGARPGGNPEYLAGARALGAELAARNIGLVYGGASIGLMGAMADAVLAAGGEVIGVIPSWLDEREIAHRGLPSLRVVGSMHERKAKMAELSDAFVAMPGGFGTFDELFEVVTWAQIGLHSKPIGLLDTAGFFGPILRMMQHVIDEGFAAKEHAALVVTRSTPADLIDALAAFTPPPIGAKGMDMRRA